MRSLTQQPFRAAVLVLVWGGWLLFLVLTPPNLLVVGASVMTRDPGSFISLPLTLDAYRQLLDPLYLEVFLHSLYMAAMTTLVCLLIGYPFAWALSKVGKRNQVLLIFLLIVPFWTNSLVRTYALKLILATNGLLNNGLMSLGVIDEPMQLLYTEGGAVIIGLVYLLLPFMILPLYSVFEDLREDYLRASHDLGAGGRLSTFIHVIVPLTCRGGCWRASCWCCCRPWGGCSLCLIFWAVPATCWWVTSSRTSFWMPATGPLVPLPASC